MALKYKYKNYKYYSKSQKYRRGSYFYGSGSSSRAAIASARKIKHLQKRLKKSSRPIRMEFYKRYHPIQKRQKQRYFEKRQKRRYFEKRRPAVKRHVYAAKTKSKFYYRRHFAKSTKPKNSVKRISRKFSSYKKETRRSKRKLAAVVVPKKARKQLKKSVYQDGNKKRKSRGSPRSLLKFLKNTIPLAKKKRVYIKRSHKEKITAKNTTATVKKFPVVELKDREVGPDDVNKTDVHVASTSYSELSTSTSGPNTDSVSKELETPEERTERSATGNTELTAVKGSMDLTATVDIDLTTRVDSVDLTEEVDEVDLTQTFKDIVDHPEVEKEIEIINEIPMEDKNAYDELMGKKDLFKVEVDEHYTENNVQQIPY